MLKLFQNSRNGQLHRPTSLIPLRFASDMTRSDYRRREFIPEWVVDRCKILRSNRSASAMRSILNDFSKPDKEAQRRFLKRDLGWHQPAMKHGHATRFSNNQLSINAYGPDETVTYTQYMLPVRFAVLKRVYRDILRIYPQFTPKRVLDFGCGPATAACAMIDIWNRPNKLKYEDNNKHVALEGEGEGVEEDLHVLAAKDQKEKKANLQETPPLPPKHRFKYTGVDISQSMLEAAKFIIKDQPVDSIFFDKISDVYKRSQQLDEKYDVIVCAYTLSELANDHMKRTATQLMYELLDDYGVLIFIDKGDPIGSHHVRTARQFLLDLTNPNKKWRERYSLESEAKVLAPCTHNRLCPLEKGSWCSFSQKVEIPALYKKEEEKFSYVVMTKLPSPSLSQDGDNNENDNDVIEMKTHNQQKCGVEEALTLSQSQARIVRSPLKKRGHVVLDVCHPVLKDIQRVVLSKSYLRRSQLDYKTIKRAQWGGAIPASECKDIRSV